jgi:5-methylcytosine-specific restriction endonuclease McrA
MPYHGCPNFDECSVNKCPLDPLASRREILPNDTETRCNVRVSSRKAIAERWAPPPLVKAILLQPESQTCSSPSDCLKKLSSVTSPLNIPRSGIWEDIDFRQEATKRPKWNVDAYVLYKDEARGNPQYVEWRKAVLERDNYICIRCGDPMGVIVHHINRWIDSPHERYDVANGICLCLECHKQVHFDGEPLFSANVLN